MRMPATRSNGSVRSPETRMIGRPSELLSQLMADLVAGECGEGHFEDDEARLLKSRSVDHVVSAVHLHDVVARFLEDSGSKRTRLLLVVGDQNRSQAAGVACHTFLARHFARCHTPSFLRRL